MRRHALFLFGLIALALNVPASAAERPPRPYAVVAITLPSPSDDVNLEKFRKELTTVAQSRLYADLARLTLSQAVFWDRDFVHAFDPRKAPVDNLAAALRLEHHDGAGWLALAAFAAETTAEPMPGRPGVICAPALPSFDEVAFDQLLNTSAIAARDWLFPRADKLAVRAVPHSGAAAIEMLGLHFVRVVAFEGPKDDPAPARNLWARVVTPHGKPGFVAPGSLMSLDTERLCYAKDELGHWRIAGYVGRRE